MNILILGGAGFVGKNLALHLKDNHEVVIYDNLDPRFGSTKEGLSDVKFVTANIEYQPTLGLHIEQADLIINCAAQTSHPLSMTDPVLDINTNVLGTMAVLETIRRVNPKVFTIYISSSTVVGPSQISLTEFCREQPTDIYSANKLVAEKYHHIYSQAYGLRCTILRFPNLYGPWGKPQPQFGFINYFIGLAQQGKSLTVFGDGLQKRNILYVGDAVRAIEAVMKVRQDGLFFVPGSERYSVRDIAHIIARTFGVEVNYVPWPAGRREIDVGDVTISSTRFNQVFNWQPESCLRLLEAIGNETQ